MNVLVWLKRDLRLHDHPALVLAAALGPVLPVYVVEPEWWAGPEASARQWGFVAESLEDMRGELAGIGLAVRVGDAVTVLERLCRQHRIRRIVSQAEAGTPWTRDRNRRVAEWTRGAGIEWTELPQPDLAGPVPPPPALSAIQGVEPGVIPSARALRLAEDRCPHRPGLAGGCAAGPSGQFPDPAGRDLPKRRNLPPHRRTRLLAPVAASRLGHAVGAGSGGSHGRAAGGAPGLRMGGCADPLSIPPCHARKRSPQDDRTRLEVPSQSNASRQKAWEAGETGVPFLDATSGIWPRPAG